jgi:hypothetical protein
MCRSLLSLSEINTEGALRNPLTKSALPSSHVDDSSITTIFENALLNKELTTNQKHSNARKREDIQPCQKAG